MATLTTDEIARLCWDNYYKPSEASPNTIDAYLGDALHYDPDNSRFDNLSEALYDDIRDLLHNGNQEDLFGLQDNGELADRLADQLHDGWAHDPDPLIQVCDALAHIWLNHENKED